MVEAYQKMQKDKRGKDPQGKSHHACLPKANMTLNVDNDDFLKIGKILEIMSDRILCLCKTICFLKFVLCLFFYEIQFFS